MLQYKMIQKAELLEKCSYLTFAHYNACRFFHLEDLLSFGRFLIRQIDLVLAKNLDDDQWIRLIQLWLAACMAMRSSIECLELDEFFDSWKNSGQITNCYNKWVEAKNNTVIFCDLSEEQFVKNCPIKKLQESLKSIRNNTIRAQIKGTTDAAQVKLDDAIELRDFALRYYEEYVYLIFPGRLQEVLKESSCEEIKRMKITLRKPTKLLLEKQYSQVYETVEINDKPIDLPVLIKGIESDLNFFLNRKNIDEVFFTAIFDSILRKADRELFSKQPSNIPPKSEAMLKESHEDFTLHYIIPIMDFQTNEKIYLEAPVVTTTLNKWNKSSSSTAHKANKKNFIDSDEEFDEQKTIFKDNKEEEKREKEKHSVVQIDADDYWQDESDCDELNEYALITEQQLQSTLKTHLKESKSLSLAKERKYVPNNDNADLLKLYYEETTCRVFKLYGRGGATITLPWVGATAYELKVKNRLCIILLHIPYYSLITRALKRSIRPVDT